MLEAEMVIVVAVDSQGGFGKNGKIPWDCPEDFNHFISISKDIGVGVMGRHTYNDLVNMRVERGATMEDINENGVLPDRVTFVVSSKKTEFPGAVRVSNLREARREAKEAGFDRIAVLGGERLYTQAVASAKEVHITVFNGVYNCDVHFPVDFVSLRYQVTDTRRLGGDLNPLVITYKR